MGVNRHCEEHGDDAILHRAVPYGSLHPAQGLGRNGEGIFGDVRHCRQSTELPTIARLGTAGTRTLALRLLAPLGKGA